MKILVWLPMTILLKMADAAGETLHWELHFGNRLLHQMETVLKHQLFLERQINSIAMNLSTVANHTSELLSYYKHGKGISQKGSIKHQSDNMEARLLEGMEAMLENKKSLKVQMNQVSTNLSTVANHSRQLLDFHQESGKHSCSTLGQSGLVKLEPFNVEAFCDSVTLEGGWIVIQQRIDGSVKFRRNWTDYRDGFGIAGNNTEFWLGLEVIHQITNSEPHELAVEIKNSYGGLVGHARYSEFSLSGEDDKYRIKLGNYSGNVEHDAWKLQRNVQFSTFDSDNDNVDYNCADSYGGGWWYNLCINNGLLNGVPRGREDGLLMRWFPWATDASGSRMMIRPIQ